jgi:hypothetical protein
VCNSILSKKLLFLNHIYRKYLFLILNVTLLKLLLLIGCLYLSLNLQNNNWNYYLKLHSSKLHIEIYIKVLVALL